MDYPGGMAIRRPSDRVRPRGFLSRFARDERGAEALEFALLSFPFIALILGILELGMIFLISTTLENATMDASRRIRTGELQTAGGSVQTAFMNIICGEMTWMGTVTACEATLSVDVRTLTAFQNAALPDPVTGGVFNKAALTFVPGNANDIVLVRAYYPWTLFTPSLDGNLYQLGNGQTLIKSTATFRNEPYT